MAFRQRALRPVLVLAFGVTAEPLLLNTAASAPTPICRIIDATTLRRRCVPQLSTTNDGKVAPELPAALQGLVPTRFDDVPKLADTIIAGVGLAGTIITLGSLQSLLDVKLFVPPMMASGIIFFSGPKPPDPKGFLSGTICSATLSTALLAVTDALSLPEVTSEGLGVGLLLMWYKTAGTHFPPAAVLTGTLTSVAARAAASAGGALTAAATFLVFPWLSGHVVLYFSALALSSVRRKVRLAVTRLELRSLGTLDDDELADVFHRFDTDRSGNLDADELKIALRVALGDELSIEDCRRLVLLADRNGNNLIDFEEFCFICRGEVS